MSEAKIARFDLTTKNVKIKNLISQEFLMVEFDAISSARPNRNNSWFTPESMKNAVDTCRNKPILAAFNRKTEDADGHNDLGIAYDSELDNYFYDYDGENCEAPIGVIPGDAKVEIYENPTDGLTWMRFNGIIWTNYSYRMCKRLLKNKHTRVSVEVEVLDYEMIEDGKIEKINTFKLLGIAILGQNVLEGVPGARLTIPELTQTSTFKAQSKKLSFALQQLEDQNKEDQENIQKPDNDSSIENEDQPRVSMEEPDRISRYGEISLANLTYEQKKSLIAQEFRKLDGDTEDSYFYIVDLSDNYVIVEIDRATYRIRYEIDDTSDHNVTIYMETKEKVLVNWSSFESNNKEDKTDMKEKFMHSGEANDIKADESPMDNNTPDTKVKFEGKDIVENPGPEMGIVMAAEGEEEKPEDKEDKTEKEACTPEDQCKNSCEEPEKNCNSEDSDDSCKEECAKEDSCDDKMCNSEEGCKEEESCPEDKQEEGCKESEACDNKEVEGCENKETEGCKDSEACKDTEGCKETEGCEDKEEEACGDKDSECGDKMCNSDETTSETFSDEVTSETFEKFTVNVHGEDLNINQLLEKFTALEDSYNNLKEKYSAFEMKEFKAFALDTINKESRLLDETKTNVRDEVMNAIDCGKFSTKDEVEKFTVQSMAMALFNQKEVESTDNTEKESEGTKSDFEATIVKNPVGADENKVKKAKTGIDSLLEANNALKFV